MAVRTAYGEIAAAEASPGPEDGSYAPRSFSFFQNDLQNDPAKLSFFQNGDAEDGPQSQPQNRTEYLPQNINIYEEYSHVRNDDLRGNLSFVSQSIFGERRRSKRREEGEEEEEEEEEKAHTAIDVAPLQAGGDQKHAPPAAFAKCWACCGTGKATAAISTVMQRAKSDEEKIRKKKKKKCASSAGASRKSTASPQSVRTFFARIALRATSTKCSGAASFRATARCAKNGGPERRARIRKNYGSGDDVPQQGCDRQGVSVPFREQPGRRSKPEALFACPNKCGNYLVDVDSTFVLLDGQVTKKIERCPCGVAVCVQYQIVEGMTDVELMKHRCPNKRNEAEGALENKAAMALMKKLGKSVPTVTCSSSRTPDATA